MFCTWEVALLKECDFLLESSSGKLNVESE